MPDSTVRRLPDGDAAMAGTLGLECRCHQLQGTVGQDTHCGIYERRPEECASFRPSWADGTRNYYCDAARLSHGLEPLERPSPPSADTEQHPAQRSRGGR